MARRLEEVTMMKLSKSKSETSRSSGRSSWSRTPPLRRLSSISSFSSDAPIPENRDEASRRRQSWVLPGRLEDTSHFIAESEWGVLFERAIMPWTPGSLEGWAVYMLVFALVLTLPMGIDRWIHGWWGHHVWQIEIANYFLEMMGLSPLPGGGVIHNYATEDQSPGTDLAFSMHIVAGIVWLLCGFLLFFTVNKISRRAHRRLSYASGVFLVLHLAISAYVLYVDAVKHPNLTKMVLAEEIVVVSALIAGGVSAARRRDFRQHQEIMVRAFVLSVEGAGTIRLAASIIYAIGRPFAPEAASYFCSFTCYDRSASSPLGVNVGECQGAYILRFHALRLVSLYHMAMYLRTPEKVRDGVARRHLREEIRGTATWTLCLVLIIAASYRLDHDLSYLKGYAGMIPPYLQLGILASLALKDAYDRYKYSHRLLVMPRRGALIPGRRSLLVAARTASQLVLDELDVDDSDLESLYSEDSSTGKRKEE